MKKNYKKILGLLLLLTFCSSSVYAYWVWSPEEGKFINPEGASQDSADEQYDYAMQFYKEKNLDEALKQLENVIKKYPGARVASEAQYRRATIYEEKGDYWRAFLTYKELAESYPHSERLDEVMEREFKIGNVFYSGKKAKWMGIEILPSLPRAAQVFEHIVSVSPYGSLGDEAQFRLGLTRKKAGQFAKAMEDFQYLIEQYPQSEFVPEARFQLAEVSFMNSAVSFRDERALDQAASNVDKYLSRYGTTEEAEKAAKLMQAIDEKNAEKNFRIGHYYEKQKHLQSALIYYTDVARRYPSTHWGVKAVNRMKALEQPVEFIKGQASEVDQAIQEAQRKLQALGDSGDPIEKGQLKREVERLEQKRKAVDQNKKDSINARKDDLERREKELKAKFKKLKEKQKLLEKNPSEDLKRALDRWEASLNTETERLNEERSQLGSWRSELGMKDRQFSLDMLPFIDDDISSVEKIRKIEAKKIYAISGEKKELLSEKELLYKQYSEVLALLGEKDDFLNSLKELEISKPGSLPAQVAEARKALELLEAELDKKEKAYESRYGKDGWLSSPLRAAARSWQALNPFASSGDWDSRPISELLEVRMHLRERIATQQALVETLSQAFDSELAVQEQKRLLSELESKEEVDVLALRKEIKALEKSIRSGYDEIDERHKHKKELLSQLDAVNAGNRAGDSAVTQTARVVTAPVAGVLEVSRVFFFGRKAKDVKITETADKDRGEGALSSPSFQLREDIELESLLIEDRYEKVLKMQRQLEALKAKASLNGGNKFRSAFIKIPYEFIQEAVESADRLVPRKDRQDVLIQLLDKETQELEQLKTDQSFLEAAIAAKTPDKQTAKAPNSAVSKDAARDHDAEAHKAQLQTEIQALAGQVEAKRSDLKRTVSQIDLPIEDAAPSAMDDTESVEKNAETVSVQPSPKARKKLRSELERVEKTILKLIKREEELDQTEFSILEKRIKKIDEFINDSKSKSESQDLLVERERIENRLNELKLRQNFLNQELGRFGVQEPAKV